MQHSAWALLKDYNSQIEADIDVGILKGEDVPTLLRGPEIGIFGPGFSGATPRGVHLYVPEDLLEFARELIGIA